LISSTTARAGSSSRPLPSAAALEDAVTVHEVPAFDDAVSQAAKLAQAGDAVLLSPACASFDQFDNFESRGNRFRALMKIP